MESTAGSMPSQRETPTPIAGESVYCSRSRRIDVRIAALTCFVVATSVSLSPAQPQTTSPGTGRATNTPRIVSPEIAPDRRVTFRLLAPKASDVTLTGEFLPTSADPSAALA